MGNQVDEIDLYQYSGLVRTRAYGDGLLLAQIAQASAIVRSRVQSGTGTIESTFDQLDENDPVAGAPSQAIVRERVADGGPIVWTSNVFMLDTPVGYAYTVRDFGDPSIIVFSVSDAGDIVGETVTITQRGPTDVALTILSDAAASNAIVFKIVNPSSVDVFRIRENGAMFLTQSFDIIEVFTDANPKATYGKQSLKWGPGGATALDTTLRRSAVATLEAQGTNFFVSNVADTIKLEMNRDGYMRFPEIADPSAAPANEAKLYVKDNGAGKTQLAVRFNTGAVQIIATEP